MVLLVEYFCRKINKANVKNSYSNHQISKTKICFRYLIKNNMN